jgi:hypothetical protein
VAHEIITLTERQLEHINIQRRLRGKPLLNLAGFEEAVKYAWGEPHLRPVTEDDWAAYLIVYECFNTILHAHRVTAPAAHLTIRPCPGHTL